MSDKTMIINGVSVSYTDEPNIIEVIRKAGIEVPTFCYRPDLTQFGACRMCVVEIEGRGLQASCTMPPEPGLKIETHSAKVRAARKTILELLLANHDRECTTCERSGACSLQEYSEEYGISKIRYPEKQKTDYLPLDESNPSLIRDPNKCILCGACVRACNEWQCTILGFANRGSKTVVQPMAGKDLANVECILCGQCEAVCPTGAIIVKSDIDNVWKDINNKDKKVAAQIAPSVRVALGEEFGLEAGKNTIGLIYAALRKIGFDFIYDTNFTADLTIVEEGTEFLERLQANRDLPMFTSCCQSWVKYVEQSHPEMIKHLSSCRSPMSMLSPLIKENISKEAGCKKEDMTVVAIMPCTSKKAEAKREQLKHDGNFDTDYVITTQELARMIREAGIDFKALEPEKADSPYQEYTGAGTIFGASGGVAEAAVRTTYELLTGEPLTELNLIGLRGISNRCREVEFDLKGTKVTIRAVSTIQEAEKAIQEIKDGSAKFQLLEVMACPGGCVNGGGQPRTSRPTVVENRACGLYKEDTELEYRKSHENPEIKKLYDEMLEKPGSHKSHEYLHTSYTDRFKGSYRDLG